MPELELAKLHFVEAFEHALERIADRFEALSSDLSDVLARITDRIADLLPEERGEVVPQEHNEVQVFDLVITGDQETPPVETDASGTGTVVWDESGTTAAYQITLRGVDFGPILGQESQTESTSDDVTAMHFHSGVRGEAGPVVFGQINPAQDSDDLAIVLNPDGSWTVSGVWETTDPANVSLADFADTLSSTQPGEDAALYFNVHTNAFPMGEIRGQLVRSSEADAVFA